MKYLLMIGPDESGVPGEIARHGREPAALERPVPAEADRRHLTRRLAEVTS